MPPSTSGPTRTEFNALASRVTAVENRLTALEGRVSAIEDRITVTETRQTSTEGQLLSLESRVSKLEEEPEPPPPPPQEPPKAILVGPSAPIQGGSDYTLTVYTDKAVSATLNGVDCPLSGPQTFTAPNENTILSFVLIVTGPTGLTDQDSLEITVLKVVTDPEDPPIEPPTFDEDLIVTPYLKIPNFGKQAATLSKQDGNASEESTFKTREGTSIAGRLQIREGHEVTYDIPPEDPLTSVNENGDE